MYSIKELIGVLAGGLVMLGLAGQAAAESLALDFAGAQGGLDARWAPMTFEKIPRHTRYRLVTEDAGGILEAEAEASASGLRYALNVGLTPESTLSWRWKVSGVLARGDVSRRDGDDYPARIYVTFDFDEGLLSWGERMKLRAARMIYGKDLPFAAINYIWASKAKKGLIVPNPYTDRVRMIVVDSGAAEAGQWRSHRRNLMADFEAAFGFRPRGLTGVAVMTDTDNTGERATAWYTGLQLENITLNTSSKVEAK